MQVDDFTHDLYQREAPELLEATEQAKEAHWIMRKNPATGFCVKLDGGLCSIHAKYGDRFLGDACHFYPRVTRSLGERTIMTATMSCPEIARLALFEAPPCGEHEHTVGRLPEALKNYLPASMEASDALAVHHAFINAANDDNVPVEVIYLRIASAVRSLERIDPKDWPAMAPFYLQNADARLLPAQRSDVDPFHLLHALCGLVVASHKSPSARLMQTIEEMEAVLQVKLDWANVQIAISPSSMEAHAQAKQLWYAQAAMDYSPVLRRWLQMQMSLGLFPFGGLGGNFGERITMIGVRLATIKLALMCNYSINGELPTQDVVVRVVQGLSRFLDHLGDPVFSLSIYKETGWVNEARMRGLLE